MSINLVEHELWYLSSAEAADLFGVKRETIYRHIRRGTLPAVRLGRMASRPPIGLRVMQG